MQDTDRQQEVLRTAHDLYTAGADWVTFFREVLGVEGVVRRNFATRQDLADFEQTDAYSEIQQMLRNLRQRSTTAGDQAEPTRVITVRLPRSLHEALRTEAHEHKTSMNKLCISKLLQFIDNEFVPTER